MYDSIGFHLSTLMFNCLFRCKSMILRKPFWKRYFFLPFLKKIFPFAVSIHDFQVAILWLTFVKSKDKSKSTWFQTCRPLITYFEIARHWHNYWFSIIDIFGQHDDKKFSRSLRARKKSYFFLVFHQKRDKFWVAIIFL